MSEVGSNVGSDLEKKAEEAEKKALVYREQAAVQKSFVDTFENTAMLIAHLSEQMGNIVHQMNAPKVVERDEKGKALRITNAS